MIQILVIDPPRVNDKSRKCKIHGQIASAPANVRFVSSFQDGCLVNEKKVKDPVKRIEASGQDEDSADGIDIPEKDEDSSEVIKHPR